MTAGAPHDRRSERAQDSVRPAGAVDLKCGHWTENGPIVVFSNGRRLYDCPEGCGFMERKT